MMNIEWFLQTLVATLLGGFLSGSVVAGLMRMLFHQRTEQISAEVRQQFQRRTEQISAEVRQQFEQELLRYRSTMVWKEQVLSDLLGPVAMQLDRTERAFKRWKSRNLYIETKIIREGNKTIRDLLLSKAHLIPRDLLRDARRLVEHYDRWLEEYDRIRGGTEPQLDKPFVFVGPAGYPFPSDAAQRFQERFEAIWTELYGTGDRTS
jgi:hypothetical protein